MLALGGRAAVVVQDSVPLEMVQRLSAVEPVVFVGIESRMTTPAGSVEGPLFWRVIVYVVEPPAVTLVTPSLFVIWRSAAAPTVSVSVELLFPGVGSVIGEEEIVAVLLKEFVG